MLKRSLVSIVLGVLVASAALAQGQDEPIMVAPPESVVEAIGSGILYFVDGRTLEQTSGDEFNPFGINGDDLLFSVGAFFVTTDYSGEAVHEGQLSIYPQFVTPLGAFGASESTPPIIPFALMQQGICHAGYVAGYPVPNMVYSVDMSGQVCHAAMVEELVYAAFASSNPSAVPPAEHTVTYPDFDPANPTDEQLDIAVWAAYNGAYALATADPDYQFIRDGYFEPVRQIIGIELAKEGMDSIRIEMAESADAAFGCAEPGTTVLRVGFTPDETGITLVASSSRRTSTYQYDQSLSNDLDVRPARNCGTGGVGRQTTLNVR